MVSMKLAVAGLVAMVVVVQAAPNMKGWGGQQQFGGFGGQQNGFGNGFENGFGGGFGNGFGGGFGGQGGNFGGSSGQGGPWSNGMGMNGMNGMNGGSNRYCQAPACYTPQTSNDTINQINTLWKNNEANTNKNCTLIQEQEDAIVKTAVDQYLNTKVATLTPPAQGIYNQFKAAVTALMAATVEVQKELADFNNQLMYEGQPGPSQQCFMNRRFGK
uniref:SXP/RAL-2 family protein Ani s 5-like cation-binding domain-containing protein n=1 Tax=Plectus sambesii TaxID=2011161 RepID=A0A914UWE6_9BILA